MARYELRSNVVITEEEYQYSQGVVDSYGIKGLSNSNYRELLAAIEESDPELAQDIDRDSELYGVVTSIIVGIDEYGALTIVDTERDLTEDEISELVDYVESQYSDGWGEGFEQHHFSEYSGDVEVYDEDEEEYYNEYTTYELYAQFWQNDNFNIEVKKVS